MRINQEPQSRLVITGMGRYVSVEHQEPVMTTRGPINTWQTVSGADYIDPEGPAETVLKVGEELIIYPP